MSEVIELLWRLQTQMTQLADTEGRLATKPPEFATIDDRFQQMNDRIDALRGRVAALSAERREFDRELVDEQERLAKYQGQLMQVKNQQQYAAAWKEIDTSKKRIKELEDEIFARMSGTEEIERELATLVADREPIAEAHEAARLKWQESLGDLREEAEALRAAIGEVEKAIPPGLLREFQAIYRQRNGLAMVKLNGETCGGCRVRIRPNVVQQLRRGELSRCEGCRRILYFERQAMPTGQAV